MDLTYSDDQVDFRGALRGFCASVSREADIRRAMGTAHGYDQAVWARMADELGLQGMTIPEEHGGSGFGVVERALVFEELGRSLACGPVLATAGLAVPLLADLERTEARARVLERIASERTVVSVAVHGDAVPGAPWDGARLDGAWRLTGVRTHVLDGAAADVLVVAATGPGGPALVAVDASAPGVQAEPVRTMDLTRRLATVRFDGAEAALLASGGAAEQAFERALDVAAIALAAEQLGGADHLLALTTAYAKDRVQFGRPIGSFQAVKHRLAELFVELELARSTVRYAAWAADHLRSDLPLASSLAFVRASDAAFRTATEAIQLHGGIAFTWEHQAHLHLKRIKSSHNLLRPVAWHRARLQDRIAPAAA